VRPHDRPIREGTLNAGVSRASRAHAERPLRPGKILRLNSAEQADDLGGVGESGTDEVLAGEPAASDVHAVQR
jgi:hypothetical protein